MVLVETILIYYPHHHDLPYSLLTLLVILNDPLLLLASLICQRKKPSDFNIKQHVYMCAPEKAAFFGARVALRSKIEKVVILNGVLIYIGV